MVATTAGDTLTEMLTVLGAALSAGEADGNKSGGKASTATKPAAKHPTATNRRTSGEISDADKLRALNKLMLGTRRDSVLGTQQLFSGSIWYTGAKTSDPSELSATNASYFGILAFAAPFTKKPSRPSTI